MNPYVGQTVHYFGSTGKALAAIVTGTAADFDATLAPEGTEPPAEGTVNLLVFSRHGRTYGRQNVPAEGSEVHAELSAQAEARKAEIADAEAQNKDAEEGAEGVEFTHVPRPLTVRYWKPIA